MVRLSDSDAFTARELSLRGFTPARIAVLIAADVDVVEDELKHGREAVDDPVPVHVVPVQVLKASIEPDAWPPPIDESTVWSSVRVRNGYGELPTEVRVRSVRLWSRDVLINGENDVWCTHCGGQFHTVAKLGHPLNGCPTGIVRNRSGMIYRLSEDDMMDDAARPYTGPGQVDLMRTPW